MADETIEDAIESNALGPKKVTGDTGSVEQHSIPDQIAADKYAKSKQAASVGLGVRFVKLVPPGQD